MARSRGKALGDATLIAKADRMAALRASLPALVAQRPIHPVRGPGHPPRELKMPAPRPVPPAAARIIREQHAAAVEDVAGR